MSLIFTKSGGDPVEVIPVEGSVNYGDGHDDRGDALTKNFRAGVAKNGSCKVVLDSEELTLETALALRSGKGAGDYAVTGDDLPTAEHSSEALIDIKISGDSVLSAQIDWKGTISE